MKQKEKITYICYNVGWSALPGLSVFEQTATLAVSNQEV